MKKFGASIACDGWDSTPGLSIRGRIVGNAGGGTGATSNDDTFWGIDREEEAATLILRI